ncbi:hypothetical protein ED733_005146 [Metarhizium rileyi]|uniref:Threonylcarbamoyl-AMP synthase n=1 Tax=Metarhizium rileyi (strain RCEF 4871) TaxID=1649241 RepID=A0A5C6G9P8_METRR|nr:hypothetical protein ED733_005146 [Metarhizium rileyi]
MNTRVVAVPLHGTLGSFDDSKDDALDRLEHWRIHPDAVAALGSAAEHLRTSDTPVAFPTETVYGLGADATRSASVKGIYAAKGRPSDNPLIVHVSDLDMLRNLLGSRGEDAIPARYRPLVRKFWPGPLTVLLPVPDPSPLAPEVTAGLGSFGVRMPASPLALTLIRLAGVPLAAPSANASTKPSPTVAQHVKDDLDGRIELILDGGACQVGVESTVVDGLCDPPVVLRPGGVGIDELRSCPGWENVVVAYKDHSEEGKSAPRAPGMKYKHYSPRARVVLYESSCKGGRAGIVGADADAAVVVTMTANGTAHTSNGNARRKVGVIRTKRWEPAAGLRCSGLNLHARRNGHDQQKNGHHDDTSYNVYTGDLRNEQGETIGELFDISLGRETRGIAQGLFSALRELDRRGADIIFVDGIDDGLDIAAAVMNRLRKAASEIRA